MKHYILRFFLIFACVSLPLHSFACWDDDWDDYYSYDDYDDDWWDYDDDWWWDDDDDDWWNDDVDYGDIGNDDYDIDGGELDDVVVTPDDDWGLDDDWWRVDYSYEEDDNGEDLYEEEESLGGYYPDNNKTTTVTVPPLLPNEIHEPKSNEKLFKENLPAIYPSQSCHFNCFTTTLAICDALITGDFGFKYYDDYLRSVESWFSNECKRDICEKGIYWDEIDNFLNVNGLFYEYITEDKISSCIDNGDLVMVTIADGTHEVVVVGYYDEFGDIDAYQCVNPGNGMYETHYGNEFKKDLIIRYCKNN